MNLPRPAWNELSAHLAPGTNLDAIFDKLNTLHSEPHRHYHNARHITECLAEFQTAKHLAPEPDLLELALWLHDAIYDPHRHDNEDQSAALTRELFEPILPVHSLDQIAHLIVATKHLAPAAEPDSKLIVDIDLSILGKDPKRFDEYEQQIRAEYSFVPDALFRQKRAEILNAFLARTRIYQTTHFHDRCEKQARANLARSIARLSC
jgi:predicted metal-dependent HD superfamily phosphohydrolase